MKRIYGVFWLTIAVLAGLQMKCYGVVSAGDRQWVLAVAMLFVAVAAFVLVALILNPPVKD